MTIYPIAYKRWQTEEISFGHSMNKLLYMKVTIVPMITGTLTKTLEEEYEIQVGIETIPTATLFKSAWKLWRLLEYWVDIHD